jgi:hypothetical protein
MFRMPEAKSLRKVSDREGIFLDAGQKVAGDAAEIFLRFCPSKRIKPVANSTGGAQPRALIH